MPIMYLHSHLYIHCNCTLSERVNSIVCSYYSCLLADANKPNFPATFPLFNECSNTNYQLPLKVSTQKRIDGLHFMGSWTWTAEAAETAEAQAMIRRSDDASHKRIPALFKWNVQLIWINRHKSFNATHHSSNIHCRRHSWNLTIVSGFPTRAKWHPLHSGRRGLHTMLLLCWPVFMAEMHRRKRMRGCA